jgi:HEAT repeat protein
MNVEMARNSLSSSDPEMLKPALRIMAARGMLQDLQPILKCLKHEDDQVKTNAVITASSLIRENLLTYFQDLAPEVREKLGQLMESLDPQVVAEIGKDVYCQDEQRRLRAVQILGLLRKNPKVREILAELVKDRDEKIRATAINLLGKVVGPNDQQIILSLLSDKDLRVRANTVEALESLGSQRMVPILLRFRSDPSNRIRGNVLKALHTLGHTRIEEHIEEMLRSGDEYMHASALWVISQTKVCNETLEDLAGKALVAESEMVVRNATSALEAMNTPRAAGYIRYLGV